MMDTPTGRMLTPLSTLVRRIAVLLGLLVTGVALGACTLPVAPANARPQVDAFNGAIANLDAYVLPTPAPTTQPDLSIVIATQGSRANIRGGPATDFPIVGKANPGEAYEVVGRSEDNTWWQICCIRIGADGNPIADDADQDEDGWIADSVVRLAGEDEAVGITRPVFTADLAAEWAVNWECGSERCEVAQCTATVQAQVTRAANQQLLPIEHQVTWDDACFDTDTWVFEVNQYSGKERTGEYQDNFLYSYWLGREPGRANGVFTLQDERAAAVYCSGPHEVEIEEGGGWTTVYEGNTCHDVQTGMLVYLSYNKRWLFTGEYEGESYERAYFGDYETLEQKLVETTAELLFVEKRR